MPFQLCLKYGDEKPPSTAFLEYVAKNEPTITRREDGGIDVGLISFDTLQTSIVSMDSLDAMASKIEDMITNDKDSTICVLFEQSTGNPILISVRNEDVAMLFELLGSEFTEFPAGDLLNQMLY